MVENDTIRLLRECNAGVKMGISSIEEVLDKVKDEKLKSLLQTHLDTSHDIMNKTETMLSSYGDDGKDPNPMAKGMSYLKTNMKIALEHTDNTIADLITEGCDMGIRSLQRYVNQYPAADDSSKRIAKELMDAEGHLREHMRQYL